MTSVAKLSNSKKRKNMKITKDSLYSVITQWFIIKHNDFMVKQ